MQQRLGKELGIQFSTNSKLKNLEDWYYSNYQLTPDDTLKLFELLEQNSETFKQAIKNASIKISPEDTIAPDAPSLVIARKRLPKIKPVDLDSLQDYCSTQGLQGPTSTTFDEEVQELTFATPAEANAFLDHLKTTFPSSGPSYSDTRFSTDFFDKTLVSLSRNFIPELESSINNPSPATRESNTASHNTTDLNNEWRQFLKNRGNREF
jgi:hypothetical protein